MRMKDVQREVLENKKRHGFNTTNIEEEFCYMYGEIKEAYEAYNQKLSTFGEEIADINIFLMGIAEIKKIDLGMMILKKLEMDDKYQGGIVMQLKEVDEDESVQMEEIQKQVHKNKVQQGCNMNNVEQDFCNLYGEVGEAYEAHFRCKDSFEEELANIAIYLMIIAENNGINLSAEILKKVERNKSREYKCNELGYMVHL